MNNSQKAANVLKPSQRPLSEQQLVVSESSWTSLLFKNASQHPNNIAVVNGLTGEQFRYSEMLTAIANVSSGLWKMGLRQNHVVSIIDLNSPKYLFAQHGIMETGAAVSYTNPSSTEYELISYFNVSKPQMIITAIAYVDKVASAAKQANCGETIVLFDGGSGPEERSSSYKSFTKYLLEDDGSESRLFAKDIVIDPKQHLAQLPHSSGTTGLPKGVMLSHYNLCANLLQLQVGLHIQPGEVAVAVIPFYHASGALTQSTTFYRGNTMVILPKFESNDYLSAINKYKGNILLINPPILMFLLESTLTEHYDLSSVEKLLIGADHVKAVLEEQFLEKYRKKNPNIDLYQLYGLTETSPISTCRPPQSKILKNKDGSLGTLLPGMEFKVVDCETGESLGPNTPGELVLKGPNVMMGYFNNLTATRECLTEDGWLKTGDMIFYDKDEYFYFVGRIKELIKCKTYQVAPAELESLLLTHPSIKDAAVIGRPDTNCGEVPLAFVVKNDATLSEEDVKQFVADRLIEQKHLQGGVYFIDEIPKSFTGKILRRQLHNLL